MFIYWGFRFIKIKDLCVLTTTMYTTCLIVCLLSFTKAQSFTFDKEIIPYSSACSSLKERFANTSAEFTLCAIRNARPIKMCEACQNQYLDVQNSYTNMSKVLVNNTSCLDIYINSDRLQIVLYLYQNNVNLWNNAKCDECFDEKNSNTTIVADFGKYFDTFIDCTVHTEDKEICPTCMKHYVKLDHYFRSISDMNDKIGVCMDIVDVMNSTWAYWSEKCCNYRRHDEYMFIGSAVAVLILTISFYIIVQFYKAKNAPTIIQQSRFFESLN